jgi:hypothetical protein
VPNRKINQINISKPYFGEQKAEKITQIIVVSDLDCYKTYWLVIFWTIIQLYIKDRRYSLGFVNTFP